MMWKVVKNLRSVFAVNVTLLCLHACGSSQDEKRITAFCPCENKKSVNQSLAEYDFVKVPNALVDVANSQSFENVELRVQGCASGYSTTRSILNSGYVSFRLSRGDTLCKAFLLQFKQHGIVFLPEDQGAPAPETGESRVYLGRDPGTDLMVRKNVLTVEQLPKEISNASLGAYFQIQEAYKGSEQSVAGNILPSVSFALAESRIEESASVLSIRVLSDRIMKEDLEVPFSVGGTAQRGEDFEFTSSRQFIRIPAGKNEGSLSTKVFDDLVFEGQEVISLRLLEGPLFFLRNPSTEIFIDDNDPIPNVVTLQFSERSLQSFGEPLRTWNDETGNRHNANQGSRKNRPTVSLLPDSTVNAFALRFTGEPTGMLVSGSKILDWETSDLGRTFALVVRTSNDIESTQVIYEQGTSKSGTNIIVQDGKLKFSVWASPSKLELHTTEVPLEKQSIRHFTCVFDRKEKFLAVYENGKFKTSSKTKLEPVFKSSRIGLGFANGSSVDPKDLSNLVKGFFDGMVATFEILDGPFSAAAAQVHSQSTLKRLGLSQP